ncbi:hypothetical protein V8F20_008206 [Naviculisporaceae sp. PSN 640]
MFIPIPVYPLRSYQLVPRTADEPTEANPHPDDSNLLRASLSPKLSGQFRSRDSRLENSVAEHCDRATFFKYHVIGLFFPVEHQYLERGAKTPWIARVVLKFHSLDDFSTYNFGWRKNHRKYFARCQGIDWESHPIVDGVTMFYRTHHIQFGTKLRPHWTASITIWAQDPTLLTRDFTDDEIDSMFNQKTNVCMEAFRVERSPGILLCPRRRIFIKYAEQPDTLEPGWKTIEHSQVPVSDDMFCIERKKAIELQDPRLCAIIEENIERQLFGKESEEHPNEEEHLGARHPPCETEETQTIKYWIWSDGYERRRFIFFVAWFVLCVSFIPIVHFIFISSPEPVAGLDLTQYRHYTLERLCEAAQENTTG